MGAAREQPAVRRLPCSPYPRCYLGSGPPLRTPRSNCLSGEEDVSSEKSSPSAKQTVRGSRAETSPKNVVEAKATISCAHKQLVARRLPHSVSPRLPLVDGSHQRTSRTKSLPIEEDVSSPQGPSTSQREGRPTSQILGTTPALSDVVGTKAAIVAARECPFHMGNGLP